MFVLISFVNVPYLSGMRLPWRIVPFSNVLRKRVDVSCKIIYLLEVKSFYFQAISVKRVPLYVEAQLFSSLTLPLNLPHSGTFSRSVTYTNDFVMQTISISQIL